MTRRLVLSYVVVTAFALALLAVPLGLVFARHERDRFLSQMEADADSMASLAAYPIEAGQPIPPTDVFSYAARTHGHVIIVDATGHALLDTQYDPGRDYSTRPEIQQALLGHRLEGRRHSDTANATLLYAAVPTSAQGRVNGAVRVTYPTGTLDGRVRRVWGALTLLCLGVLAAAALIGFVLARSIVRPVKRLEQATDEFASGVLDARVDAASGAPELRHLAATFNRMAERLARLLDSQQRFVADASHQLRTPLTALRLRLENLDTQVSERERPAISAATAEVTRMSRLVDGLLLLARDDAAARALAPVDVADIARERAGMWSDALAARDITLDVEATEPAWALAVSGAVEQLVDNLIDNALAAAPPGSIVELRTEIDAQAITLHVMDRGPGLDAESRARAFDRFWRAPDAAPGGSGLGLAIVQQLAEAGGGQARLDARDGGGLDAIVVLRTAPAPKASDVPAAGTLSSP